MELVKRLEGSEPEEVNYDFEEHYLHEDEETTKRKKGTLFTIIALIFLAILGYFGFKNFNKNEIQPIDKSLIVTNLSPENISETTKTEIAPTPIKTQEPKEIEKNILLQPKNIEVAKIQKEIKTIIPIKEEPPKILTYTEVLAQKLEAKVKEPKKIPSKPIVTKTIPQKKVIKRIVKTKPKSKKILKKQRIAIVRKGDTLNILAQRFYGSPKEYTRIIRANKSIRTSKTKLKLGQKIIIPFMPKNKRRRFVTVKKGYSLAYISKKFYGNTSEVKRIVSANYNIKSVKSTLRIGQKVYVPK